MIWLGKTGDQKPQENIHFFEKIEMNVDRAQTSHRSIKPIIVEFLIEVFFFFKPFMCTDFLMVDLTIGILLLPYL